MEKIKNAIITGANRGIGLATVKKFVENRINVWACMREPNPEIEEKFKMYEEEYGVWIHPIYFDLMDEEQVKEGVKTILLQKQQVDILVNNAAVPHSALMMMTPLNKMKEVFQINFFSQILLIQLLSKKMIRQKRGVIINLGSVGGIETNPGYLSYGSSKSALMWATKSIARELAEYGIRVNAVAPGLTDTSMGNFKNPEEREKTLQRTPMKRMAEPKEIAEAIYFLATDSASYITGQVLQVDGGRA